MATAKGEKAVLIAIFVWVVIGLMNFGATFAYFQKEYPTIARDSYTSDIVISIFMGLAGPFAIPAVLAGFDSGKHGWLWPRGNEIITENDIIHHPVYGSYPETIPYKDGMTLMPGQSTIIEMSIEIQKGEEL